MKKHLTNPRKTMHEKTMNFSVFASSETLLSERVQLKVDNVTLKDALKEIERQSDFTFLYNDASIDVNQVVTVSTKEVTVKEILDAILQNKGINYTIIDNQIVLTKASSVKMQEKKTITGKVTDSETGEGLPGVSVVEKGTNNGSITDLDGNYTLNVAEDATITVTYVGYVTEDISVSGMTQVDVALVPDIISLEDVIVIGYGTIKKSDLTGAVASVSAEDLSKSAVSGVDQALQGRTAGVTVTTNTGSPGQSPSVRIRGIGTITKPDPFFVIDGVPVEASDVGALNPGDIESTEILKDASAAAIYGARAANGVVLITTRKGKAGTSSVTLDAYTGIQTLAKKYELVNAEQFVTIRNKSGIWGWEDSSKVPSTDWQDEIFRAAKISDYQLSFLGGTEKLHYALIGSYHDQDGIIKGTDYNRLTFRLNTDAQIKPWLNVGENVSYSTSKKNLVPEHNEFESVVATALTIDPATPVYDSAGNPSTSIRNNIKNPIGAIERDEHVISDNKLLGNLFMDIKPVKWFYFRTTAGVTQTTIEEYQFLRSYNESTTYFRNLDELINGKYTYNTLIWENTLNFNKTFGIKHNLQAVFGYTHQSDIYRYSIAVADGVPEEPDILRFISNATDPANIRYGNIISTPIGSYNIYNPLDPYDDQNVPYDAYLLSYLGRVMYNYADLVDIHASVRRDGSSKFGGGNKWGVFPSFAGGLKLSQLPFLKDNAYINFLKLRIGWGELGNQEVGNYRAFTGVFNNFNYSLGPAGAQAIFPGASPLSIGNLNLKWESTAMTNFGLDLNMLENKIVLNADYFIRTTKDMLIEVPIPGYTGVRQAPLVNRGSIQNQGIELNATYKSRTADFSYQVNGNIAFIKNEVLELGSEDDVILGGQFRAANYISHTKVGHPVGSFYGFVTDGYWQTQEEIDAANALAQQTTGNNRANYDQPGTSPGDIKFKDLDGDHQITDADQTFIGNPTPKFTYGINIDLSYKIFDLSIFGQGVQGNKIFQALIYYHEASNAYWNMDPNMLDTWTPDNTDAAAPRLDQYNAGDNLRLSDRYVKNGSFFRFKNVQLGVNLPKSICDPLKIQKLRIYVAGQNLYTISKYTGFDPEIGTGTQVNDIGIDRGFYPVARSYMVGASLTF
jgi:TonB-linked SusC/RagA family outer membrane protein